MVTEKKVEHTQSSDTPPKSIPTKPTLSIEELTDVLQRLQAEFDNYRKRSIQHNDQFMKYATQEIMLDLLPIVDHLSLALANTTQREDFIRGVEMILSQLVDFLERKGVTKIDTSGDYDPKYHEALLQEAGERPGLIIEELQPGYRMHDRVLRVAKVKVTK